MSGFSSPAISSPSCEIKNELSFPPLPVANQQQPQQQQLLTQQSQPEAAKVTPKISQLSELEEQLSKIHQKPFTQTTQQQQQAPSYSEAVRQSPTTVQQQFPQQQAPQIQNSNATQQPVVLNSTPTPIVSAQKVSRFQVSKVEEQKAANLQQPTKPLLSPEIEVTNATQNLQNTPQLQTTITMQPSQAQAFFQQHQGGVVSGKYYFNNFRMLVFYFLLNVYFLKKKIQENLKRRIFLILLQMFGLFDLTLFFYFVVFCKIYGFIYFISFKVIS